MTSRWCMPDGRITCILGRNGVGKTTLLMNVMGLLRPTIGAVFMEDRDLTDLPADKRAAAGLGLVPQGRRIFPRLTVEENLRVGLSTLGRRATKIPEEIYDLFPDTQDDVQANGRRPVRRPAAATGDRARARRRAEGPPSGRTHRRHSAQRHPTDRRRSPASCEERGMTIVMVEQYLDFVKEIGDRFYLMDRRRVVASGLTSDLNADLIHRHLSV